MKNKIVAVFFLAAALFAGLSTESLAKSEKSKSKIEKTDHSEKAKMNWGQEKGEYETKNEREKAKREIKYQRKIMQIFRSQKAEGYENYVYEFIKNENGDIDRVDVYNNNINKVLLYSFENPKYYRVEPASDSSLLEEKLNREWEKYLNSINRIDEKFPVEE